MKTPSAKQNIVAQACRLGTSKKYLLPALFAVSGGLGAMPAAALELGELSVHSTLGQPLRASIAIALAPNEQLTNTCVSLQRATSEAGLPVVSEAAVGIANGVISLTGRTALNEPMLSMRVNVKCPYTPNLTREYLLFLDPPNVVAEAASAASSATPVAQSSTARVARSAPRAARPRPVAAPIGDVTRYRVQRGESLSEIAQRIENRPVGLWNAVMAIFEANPDAFIDNDPNLLKAGSWLNIPDFNDTQARVVAAEQVTEPDVAGSATAAVIDASVDNVGTQYTSPETGQDYALSTTADDATVADSQAIEAPTGLADMKPGDVILDSDRTAELSVGSKASETIILDTPLEAPATGSQPNGTVYSVQSPSPDNGARSWFLWLAGSGIAIIIGLLLFGRRFRNRFGSAPIGAVAEPQDRRQTEAGSDLQSIEVTDEQEYAISDDSPTEENLVLDADLIDGTGLDQGTEMHLAQDFGFAATTHLDIELPEEMSSGGNTSTTDIIPPMQFDVDSILESEVLPGEIDYDMSVIMDATRMPQPDDVTERDLKAVAVNAADETLISDEYTVNKDVDFNVLEQDYEDELTATQALNREIANAALELAHRMEASGDETGGAMDNSGDVTSEMPLAAEVSDLDVTAQMAESSDDLDLTAQMPESNNDLDLTAQMPESNNDPDDTGIRNELTAEFAIDDKTVEMPANDADMTAEMPVKSGKADTKVG